MARQRPNWLAINVLIAYLLGVLPGTRLSARAQSGELPPPELITDRQGLPQAFVPAIVQDRQGFIWMATRDGLARYDGSRFKVFQPDPDGNPSLTSADVAQIRLDHHGNLWIANERGDLDVFDPATERFTNLSRWPVFKQLNLNTNQLNRYCIDREDRLWITSMGNGLVCLNRRTNQIHRYHHRPNQSPSLSDDYVVGVLEAPNGIIWALTRSGLDGVDANGQTIRHYLDRQDLDAESKGLWVRPSGDVVVLSNHRLLVVKPNTGQVRTYPLPATPPPSGYAQFAEDQRGNLYIAWGTALFTFTEPQGVRLLDAGSAQPQQTYQSAFVDRSEVLWLGTAGAGVRRHDLRAQPFQTARYGRGFVADLLTQSWLTLTPQPWPPPLVGLTDYNFRYTFDSQGRLWFNMGSSDLYRVNFRTRKTERIPFPVSFRSPFIGLMPCPLATDPDGRVWAAHDSTAYWYDEPRAQWQAFPHRIPRQPGNALQILTVDAQALWLATSTAGLLRIDRAQGRIDRYTHRRGDTTSLSSNALLCMAPDPDDPNRLWIGTFGSGLCRFDKRTGQTNRLSLAEGLPNNVIYSVIADRHGDVWIGTNKGIGRINRQTLRVQTYTIEDGILADEFNRFHFLYLPGRLVSRQNAAPPAFRDGSDHDDRILLGGLEGITAFYPRQIQADTFQPAVEMTALYVNNQPVKPGPDSPFGTRPVQAASELELPYDQNFLTVEFAALQFNRPGKNRYRYQLLGLNPDWVESRRPEAVFTGLQPGKYTLRLNATNVSGLWSPHIRTLSVMIQPPWWATGWAYALYALVVAGMAYGLFREYVNRFRLRQAVRLRQQEADQLRDTNAMKTRFFANITHEFRTPLTLILAPAEQLMDEPLAPHVRRRLLTIEQNAGQLLRLINQLLDLSRLDASVMPLHESVGDPTGCVRGWLQPLADQADGQGIALTVESEVTGSYWFDVEKFERIVYNLTANALKFTPANARYPAGASAGSITVLLTALPEGLQLTVADTGIGIPQQQLPYIFDRFYQVEHSAQAANSGTGVGLALVKELVQLQQGRIDVVSEVGRGTTFTVELPYRPVGSAGAANENEPEITVAPSARPATPDTDVPLVLVVEDNDALARFIADCLPTTYQVRRAANGRDGLAQALDCVPDLIISDVMMPGLDWPGLDGPVQAGPEMDGYALCGRLKTDLRTSHIPVILLTAKVTMENRLEGLAQGADEYLTKPFSVAELRLRVHNLLENQRRQREWLRRTLTASELTDAPPPPADPFLTRLYAVLDANLSNPALSVDRLLDEMAMSRTNLHRKVKALTGLSVGELVRQYRLKAATELLRQGFNSSETAVRVGFENPSYFAKCFRELYGVTPGEFVRSHPSNIP